MDKNRYNFLILLIALSFTLPAIGCGGSGGGEALPETHSLEIRQEIDNVRLEGSGTDSFTTFDAAHYTEWNWDGWEVNAFDHLQNIHFSPYETPFYLNIKKKLYDGSTELIVSTHYFQECTQATHSHEITFETIPTELEVSFHIGADQATLTVHPPFSMNARVTFTLTFDCRGGEALLPVIPPSLGGGSPLTPIMK